MYILQLRHLNEFEHSYGTYFLAMPRFILFVIYNKSILLLVISWDSERVTLFLFFGRPNT